MYEENELLKAANKYELAVIINADLKVNDDEDNYDAGARDAISQFAPLAFISGANWMRERAIEAYKKSCDFNALGDCASKNAEGECNCELLKDFIAELS